MTLSTTEKHYHTGCVHKQEFPLHYTFKYFKEGSQKRANL